MKKSALILCGICLLLLCGCSQADTNEQKDMEQYKKSIESYNRKEIKQVVQQEIIDGVQQDSNCIITVDKKQNRAMREYEGEEPQTYIFSLENGKWYSYGKITDGAWHKNEQNDIYIQDSLEMADIYITEKSAYEIEKEEKIGNTETIKIKISTPNDKNLAVLLEDNNQITDSLKSNEDFSKTYNAVKNKKETVTYVWFDSATNELLKEECDITDERILLHYYMKLTQNSPIFQDVPEKITAVISYTDNNDIKPIEIPDDNI